MRGLRVRNCLIQAVRIGFNGSVLEAFTRPSAITASPCNICIVSDGLASRHMLKVLGDQARMKWHDNCTFFSDHEMKCRCMSWEVEVAMFRNLGGEPTREF